MQSSIGAFEAKTHFGQLIERARNGEEILITKRGKAVAKIIPAKTSDNLESAKVAVMRLRILAEEIKFDHSMWEEWKNYRDLGKR